MPDDRDRTLRDEPDTMHHREITLPDGRYMIFYTFDGDEAKSTEHETEEIHV